jgi:hypothetical protein
MTDYRELAQLAGLGLGVLAAWVVGAYVAFVGWGLWAAVGYGALFAIGLAAPWTYVRVLLTPLGKELVGAAFLILAQLTFGAGALVRRDDGAFEWRRLREDDAGLFTVLADGTEVRFDGDRGDLPKVAWAPLAVGEQKTSRNLDRLTVDDGFETERPDPADGGDSTVTTPLALADGGTDGWLHLDATKVSAWVRDSAGAELPRNGLRKALEEEGGQQQISTLVTMVGAGVLMVLGFGMTAVVLML